MPSQYCQAGNPILWFRKSNSIVLPTAELSPSATAAVLILDTAFVICGRTIVRLKYSTCALKHTLQFPQSPKNPQFTAFLRLSGFRTHRVVSAPLKSPYLTCWYRSVCFKAHQKPPLFPGNALFTAFLRLFPIQQGAVSEPVV